MKYIIISLGASRRRKDWNKIKNEDSSSFDLIASPSSDDYNLRGSSILDFIQLVMTLEGKGHIPSYESAKILLQDEEKLNHYAYKVPEYDGAIKLPPDSDGISKQNISCTYETNYDANNATVDVPLQQDLATDKTLEILLAYSESLAKNCLENKKNDDEDSNNNFTPIMNDLCPYLLGDGNPIWGIYKLLRKNEGKYGKRMPAYFGGFHLVLETHKKRGSLFADTHLCDIFRQWRPSDKQLEWVMSPGDPNQVNDEMMMYHLGKCKL